MCVELRNCTNCLSDEMPEFCTRLMNATALLIVEFAATIVS